MKYMNSCAQGLLVCDLCFQSEIEDILGGATHLRPFFLDRTYA